MYIYTHRERETDIDVDNDAHPRAASMARRPCLSSASR